MRYGPGVVAHAGLDAIYQGFAAGYADLDAVAVGKLYTESSLYLPPGTTLRRGRAEIQAGFERMFKSTLDQGLRLTITFQIEQRDVSQSLAYDVGIFTMKRYRDDVEVSNSRGKYVVVAKRSDAGKWLFQVDSYSGLALVSRSGE